MVDERNSSLISRDLPSFPAVRAFEAAARHLSFKNAAEELHVTQSAVSHQIRSLEEYLGIDLFRRLNRGVALTGGGKAYLEKVSEVLDLLAAATGEVRNQTAAGPLYVRSTPAFASRWLVPRLNDFNRWHPDIELHISTSLEHSRFPDDGIDVDIRFGAIESTDLHAEPFLESTRFPVATPALLAKRRLKHPGDLKNCVLLHDEVGDSWGRWFECAGVDAGDTSRGPRFAHCDLVLQAAARGQGVALAYGVLVTDDLAAGTLKRVFDINLPSTVIYSFVCPQSALDQPRIAAFRDWLISSAALDNLQSVTAPGPRPIRAFG